MDRGSPVGTGGHHGDHAQEGAGVDCEVLYAENRAQILIVLTARPGTESHTKLQLLSVIGHQQLTS